jgi:drug/metabolite transporter (DMT)-like permease
VSFSRLTAGHWIAFVAALGLLLAMAPDWYTDKVGDNNRYHQEQVVPQIDRQTTPAQSELLAEAAEKHEKNAWQAGGAIDRVILLLLLASAVLAVTAAFLRAAGRDPGPPSPSALATVTALAATLLVAYRILQPPGFDEAAIVKWGAPAGLVCIGLVAIGSRIATLRERERPAAAEEPPAEPAGAGAS